MDAKIIDVSLFLMIGFSMETNLTEFEAGIGKEKYERLVARKAEILHKKNDDVILFQQYPEKANFNPRIDRYVQIIGYAIEKESNIPEGMILHQVPAGKFVKATHKGLEKNMQVSYDFLYGTWMKRTGNTPQLYDFEIWDNRYKPELPENEIDMYVAIK
jgi:predicted transcriptional regulator YdeE